MQGRGRIATLAALAAALFFAAPAAGQGPPLDPEITTPDSIGSSRTVTWEFTGVVSECRFDDPNGNEVPAGEPLCVSPKEYTIPSASPDGVYTFTIRDALGPNPDDTATYTLDTQAPAAPALTSSPSSPSTDGTPAWSFTSDGSESGFECHVLPSDDPEPTGSGTSCASGDSHTLAADGTYVLWVRAVDAAGNASDWTSSSAYTLDTTAPALPSFSASPSSPGNDSTPSWSFASDGTQSGFECHFLPAPDPEPTSAWTACSTGDGQATSGDGEYALWVRAVDALGNASPWAKSAVYALDTAAPGAPTITGGPSGATDAPEATFTFARDAGTNAQCRLERNGSVAFDWSSCDSPWTYGLTTQPDGSYEFSVRAVDAAGNTSPAAVRPFVLDRPNPPPPVDNPPIVNTPPPDTGPVLREGVCINLFSGTVANDRLSGSAFGDVLLGAAGDDQIDGMAGDDCLLGDEGADRLSGAAGNDDLRGLAGGDSLSGGAGNDQVDGGPGNDSTTGDAGDDTVTGGAGDDVLNGTAGKDLLNGGKGRDRFSGGAGSDTIDARDGRPEKVDCGAGRDSVRADRKDRLTDCEKRRYK